MNNELNYGQALCAITNKALGRVDENYSTASASLIEKIKRDSVDRARKGYRRLSYTYCYPEYGLSSQADCMTVLQRVKNWCIQNNINMDYTYFGNKFYLEFSWGL